MKKIYLTLMLVIAVASLFGQRFSSSSSGIKEYISPSSINEVRTPTHHFVGNLGKTIVNGDVTVWEDQVGNNDLSVQTNAALNGSNYLEFNGSSSYTFNTSFQINSHTIFIVFKNENNTIRGNFFGERNFFNKSTYFYTPSDGAGFGDIGDYATNTDYIYSYKRDGAYHKVVRNNITLLDDSYANTNVNTDDFNFTSFGAGIGNAAPLQGKVYEVIIYNEALSDNEINKIYNILREKYSLNTDIAAELPDDSDRLKWVKSGESVLFYTNNKWQSIQEKVIFSNINEAKNADLQIGDLVLISIDGSLVEYEVIDNNSLFVDDITVISSNLNSNFLMLYGSEIRLEDFNFDFGDIRVLFPNQSFSFYETKWKENAILYEKIAEFAAKTYKVLNHSNTYLEIWPSNNEIDILANEGLTIIGSSATVSIKPELLQTTFDIYKCYLGTAKLSIDGVNFIGSNYIYNVETYPATLRPNGNTNEIEIRSDATIRSDFFSELEIGDKVFYSYDVSLAFPPSTITAIDEVNRIITIADNVISSSDDLYIEDVTKIGFEWDIQKSNELNIVDDFTDVFIDGDQYGSVIGCSFSDRETGGSITIKNSNMEGFNSFISKGGGYSELYIENCNFKKAVVAFELFGKDSLHGKSLNSFIDVEISESGLQYFGRNGAGDNGIYGSGIYAHPNTYSYLENVRFVKNIALPYRNYSSSGFSGLELHFDSLINIINNVFVDDYGEGQFILSTTNKSIITNSTIETGILRGNDCVISESTIKGVSANSTYQRGYDYKNSYFFKLKDCDITGSIDVEDNTLNNKTNVLIENCTFYPKEDSDVALIQSNVSALASFDILDIHLNIDGSILESSQISPFLQVGDFENEINVQNVNSNSDLIYGTSNTHCMFSAGANAVVSNLKLNIKNVTSNYHNFTFLRGWNKATPCVENSEFLVRDSRQSMNIKSLKNESKYKDLVSNVLNIDLDADTYFTTGTLKGINLVTGQNLNQYFSGKVTIVAVGNLIIEPNAIESNSNLIGFTSNITLADGESVTFICNPHAAISSTITYGHTITIGTGDGSKTNFTTTDFALTDNFITGTVRIVAGSIDEKLDIYGKINTDDVKGIYPLHNDGYNLTFTTPPANGVDVNIIGDKYDSPTIKGVFTMLKADGSSGGNTFSSLQTSDFTVAIGEYNLVNPTGGAITATVPSGVTQVGTEFWVVDSEGTASDINTITVDFSTNGYTVSGDNTAIMSTPAGGFKFIYIGNNKFIKESL